MTIEQQAEDIVRAMVSESWNESIETIAALLRETAELKAALKDACLNLGAEIAMATNALPSRRVSGVMAAFSKLEAIVMLRPDRFGCVKFSFCRSR